MAAIAGSILGTIVQPKAEQSNTIGITILIGIIFYVISYFIAKKMASDMPPIKQGKLVTNGIFAYIFMLLTFMVIVFTFHHQHL